MADYGVEPNSVLHLIVMLYAIPTGLDNIVFDLFWTYPQSGCDYLDASVLLYSGNKFIEVVDYRRTESIVCNSVRHSGDVMDHKKRLGHHTIWVNFKTMVPQVNKLFFTLSAWESPNISKYPNPSLKCFDPKEPHKQLCSDKMDHAAYSQAIIMCAACKLDGCWKIFSVRTLSAGNAKNYGPLRSKISNLIAENKV